MSVTETLQREGRPVIDPYRLGRGAAFGGRGGGHATGHGEGGPASKRVIVGYGFWIFLISDLVMFSCFFAAHAVLQTATAGGPSGRDLFDPVRVAAETTFLLALELHLWPFGSSDRSAQPAVDAGRSAGHGTSRAPPSCCWKLRNSRA